MIDARDPLDMTQSAEAFEDTGYVKSWMPK
jgi:hypothetical protein